jgi:hypothetical protein
VLVALSEAGRGSCLQHRHGGDRSFSSENRGHPGTGCTGPTVCACLLHHCGLLDGLQGQHVSFSFIAAGAAWVNSWCTSKVVHSSLNQHASRACSAAGPSPCCKLAHKPSCSSGQPSWQAMSLFQYLMVLASHWCTCPSQTTCRTATSGAGMLLACKWGDVPHDACKPSAAPPQLARPFWALQAAPLGCRSCWCS